MRSEAQKRADKKYKESGKDKYKVVGVGIHEDNLKKLFEFATASGLRDPTEFCVKQNKALPIRQDLGQVKNLKGSVFYGKDVKRIVKGICEQSAFYEHD